MAGAPEAFVRLRGKIPSTPYYVELKRVSPYWKAKNTLVNCVIPHLTLIISPNIPKTTREVFGQRF